MRHIPLRGLCRQLGHGLLVQQPAIWGKLPAYSDFVHHNADHAERQAWQDWVQTFWHRRPEVAARAARPRTDDKPWIKVAPVRQRTDLSRVPVAFILPPGKMPFAPTSYVQGVFVSSQDKVGRACPLIIYQCVHPRWMHRLWTSPWQLDPDRNAREAAEPGRHLLFWWTRVLANTVGHADPLDQLVQAVEKVWQAHEPGWPQVLGSGPTKASEPALRVVLEQFSPPDSVDASVALRGVYHLPWSDWPNRILREHEPLAAFWMQDAEGGYVHACENVLQLWGVKP